MNCVLSNGCLNNNVNFFFGVGGIVSLDVTFAGCLNGSVKSTDISKWIGVLSVG